MANAELNVILSADGKELAATMQKAEKDVQGLETELKQLKPAFDSVDKSLSKTASQLKNAAQSTQPLVKGIKLSDDALKKLPQSSNSATQSLINLGRVAQDAPFGFLGIANNLNPLLESFQRLKSESGSSKTALKSLASSLMGAGGVGLALSAASSLLIVFGDRLFKTSKAVDEAEEANKKYKESIQSIFSNAGKEATEVLSLIAVLKSETETRERKLAAIKELQSIQPEVFASLKLEGNAVSGLDATYKNYIDNLRTVIAVKIKQAKIEQLITKQLEKQGQALTASERSIKEGAEAFKQRRAATVGGDVTPFALLLEKERKASLKEDARFTADIEAFLKEISELSKGVDLKIDTKKPKKEVDTFYNDLIRRAKAFEAFINKTTIRFAEFEVDPAETTAQTIKKAQDFIQRALTDRSSFSLKPQVLVENPVLVKSQAYFSSLAKEAAKMVTDLQEEINKLTRRNPLLIEAQRVQSEEKARGTEFFQALGIGSADENAPVSLLTETQKEIVNTANLVNGILTPAFDNLFNAIKAGENPIKAFFDGIGQAVLQLIQKLIQAAIQALILSAITGGSTTFGKAFGSILGFKAEGGPVFANKPYVVGERGPELFIPQGGGRIIPNNEMNTGLAGIGAGMQTVKVIGQVSGRSLRLVNARQQGFENRNI
jgi:hypothetical protein